METESTPTPKPRKSTDDVDALADQLRAIEGVDDNLATFIAENWQRILGGIALGMLAIWLFGQYRQSEAKRAGEAAFHFAKLQQDASNETSNKAVVDSNLKILDSSYSGNIYQGLGTLYKARAIAAEGKNEEARALLAEFRETTPGSNRDKLLSELASLLDARILLRDQNSSSEGKQALKALSKSASFVTVEALVTLLRISSNDQERSETVSLAEEIISNRPELSDLVTREFSNLGHSLSS